MRDDERLDDLQFAGLKILQKTSGFRYGMDAVLLSDFAQARKNDAVADFGTGTGILPLLLWGRGKGSSFDCFDGSAHHGAERANGTHPRASRLRYGCAESASTMQP